MAPVRTFRDGLPPGAIATPVGSYEAEDAARSGPLISATQAGFSGTGFADFVNARGESISWSVNAQTAGLYDLKFRYALQSGNRPMEVRVNGQLVSPSLDFAATGTWTTWQYATLQSQQLLAGTNSIQITAAGSSGPNIDHLMLGVLPNFYGDYNQNGAVDTADYLLWRKSKGTLLPRGTGADGNANGVVDDEDYGFWRAQYGNILSPIGAGTSPFKSVPEPSCATHMITFAMGAMFVRSERRSCAYSAGIRKRICPQ